MRTCSQCGVPKDDEAFAWKSKKHGRRHSHCKECQARVSGQHYQAHRDDYIDRAKQRYQENRGQNVVMLRQYLEERGCVKCDCKDPDKLSFRVKPGSTAKGSILRQLGQSWDVLERELAEREIVCAKHKKA